MVYCYNTFLFIHEINSFIHESNKKEIYFFCFGEMKWEIDWLMSWPFNEFMNEFN